MHVSKISENIDLSFHKFEKDKKYQFNFLASVQKLKNHEFNILQVSKKIKSLHSIFLQNFKKLKEHKNMNLIFATLKKLQKHACNFL